jgi:hypothetical protein
MAILPGKRLGPYEIFSALGAGAMGEVEVFWRRPSRQLKCRVNRGIPC